MGSKNLLSLLLLILSINGAQCYKILIYNPRLGHSHVNFFGRIADILVEAGHDVVTYMPEWDSEVKTNGTKLARIIRGPPLPGEFSWSIQTKDAWTERDDDFIKMYTMFSAAADRHVLTCANQVGVKASMEQLKAEHFDFGITEIFNPCGYAVFDRIGLTNYATAFATDLMEIISDPLGVSSNPSCTPALFSNNGDVMNYWERIKNVWSYMKMYLIHISLNEVSSREEVQVHISRNFDPIEAVRRSSIVFVNSEELLAFPRLINHKVIFIGGIAVNKPKPLEKKFQKIMARSTNGVVLISFGSIAKSINMPPRIKRSFYEAFRSFPEVTFIWKYEMDDDYAADLSNVVKEKWVPQTDLLGHPNLRAFVSHCGQNSLTESVQQGVPLVCIPLFGDQVHNAQVARKRNFGIFINKDELSPETLKEAFRKILFDTKYRESSQRLLDMIQHKPVSPRERLLQYVEFAAKYGPLDNFDMAGNDLTFFQYYLLDIILPFLLVLALTAFLSLRLFYYVVQKLLSQSKVKNE